jgi:hypothetical protein
MRPCANTTGETNCVSTVVYSSTLKDQHPLFGKKERCPGCENDTATYCGSYLFTIKKIL